jgi:hypothetical protein
MAGGSKPGERRGGRQKGTPNKRTVAKQALADRLRSSGITPLEYMLKVMRSRSKSVADERRDDMAKAAAPFMHPRLNAIQHTGKDGEPIRVTFTGLDAGAL